jgi:putative peptidoglycan lipid II flippase
VVILALADGVRPPGAVSAYTYAYTFFQLPYGVVAVSVMSAVTPTLSARWALRDTVGFRHRLAYGLRAMLAIVIPSAVGMLILAHPLIDLVLAHGTNSVADASSTAAALAMFALGLPGFCIFLYMIRVLQAMQDTRTAFYLYLVENVINIVAGVALVGPLGVRGLALSVSIAYTAAAILAVQVIGHRIGGLGGSTLTDPLRRVVVATLVMAVLTVLAVSVSSADRGFALLGRVVLALVVATVAYFGTAGFLGARDSRQRPPPGRSGPRDRPPPYRGPVPPRPPRPGSSAPRPPLVAPFRDRLDQRSGTPSVRLLRPVVDRPGDEEEDVHGPDPGGYR